MRGAVAEDEEQDLWCNETEPIDPKRWTIHRERIKQLYVVDRLTREKTRLVMNARYQFNASDRQYRHVIENKWQLRKTLTKEDKEFVNLKTFQRQQQDGLPTKFLLCGCEINDSRLSRERRATIAAETRDRDLGPTPRNLIYYTPPDVSSSSNSASERMSTGEDRSQFMDKSFYITCAICENDIYGFDTTVLADFEKHLDRNHTTSLPVTSVLASCPNEPKALSDCPAHDPIFERDVDQGKYVTRNLNSFTITRSLNSISVIQQDPRSTLWLIHSPESNDLISFGTLRMSSDPTPGFLLSNLLIQSSSRGDKHFARTVVEPPKTVTQPGTSSRSPTTPSQDKGNGNLKCKAMTNTTSFVDRSFVKKHHDQQDTYTASTRSIGDFGDDVHTNQINGATNLVPRTQRPSPEVIRTSSIDGLPLYVSYEPGVYFQENLPWA